MEADPTDRMKTGVRQYEHELLPELPALAWLYKFSACGTGTLLHGEAIEIFDDGFLEGCIGEPWGQDLSAVSDSFGSGLQIFGDSHIIITPSHTLESLFLYERDGGYTVSNSLAFLMEYHRLALPRDHRYGAKFASVCLGIDAYERTLFRAPNGTVLRIVYDNIELKAGNKYRLIRKPPPPRFKNYYEYIQYLDNALRKAFASATHPSRTKTYRPLATCSSGYDSAASAALASRLGCHEAVTLRKSRGGESDSGLRVAERLGLRVHEFDRPETVEGSFDEVADFLATGMGGEDYCYRGFAPMLEGRLLVTGFYGSVWGYHLKPATVLERSDVSGSSLQEFRLKQNFLHIPIPMIGAVRAPDISAISHSAEMQSYRLHIKYDRPIPRRILEEMGIPRTYFGMQKKAASILLFSDNRLFGPVARRECDSLVNRGWAESADYHLRTLSWTARNWGREALAQPRRVMPAWLTWRLQKALVNDYRIFEHSRPRAAVEFSAAVTYVRRRYQAALLSINR
jgi:hypothetical protein